MTGRGSGLSDDGLIRKVQVIHSAIAYNRPNAEDPLDVMSKLGSLDIAAMCGVFLGGAACGVPVATMQPSDDESLRRIDRHRALREGKGFKTLECYTDLETAAEGLPCYGGILLECLGNYLANEFFLPECGGAQAVLTGIRALRGKCSELIIVTNEVFSGGTDYEGDTLLWLKELADVNRTLAARADRVIETICGCPNTLKGRL